MMPHDRTRRMHVATSRPSLIASDVMALLGRLLFFL